MSICDGEAGAGNGRYVTRFLRCVWNSAFVVFGEPFLKVDEHCVVSEAMGSALDHVCVSNVVKLKVVEPAFAKAPA